MIFYVAVLCAIILGMNELRVAPEKNKRFKISIN